MIHRRFHEKDTVFPSGRNPDHPDAEALLTPLLVAESLQRHQHGDYGEIEPEDEYQNRRGLAQCGMIMSVFQTPDGTAYWIQTDGTRSHTLILLPGE